MKNLILKSLVVVVCLAMLLALLPASLVSAAIYTVNIVNTQGTAETNDNYGLSIGTPGDHVRIWGTGINGTPIDLYFSGQKAAINDRIDTDVTVYKKMYNTTISSSVTDEDFLVTTLSIPSKLNDDKDLHGGTYYLYIVNNADVQKKILAIATFEIVGISALHADKTSGPVGTIVTLTGEGYASGEYVAVNYYQNDTSYLDLTGYINGSNRVDDNGQFSFSFTIPESPNSVHKIKVVGETSLAVESVTFMVMPSVVLSATSGKAGDAVIVYARGFAFNSDVDVSIGNLKLDSDSSTTITDKPDINGNLYYIMVVPSLLTAGTYDVQVKDEINGTISAKTSFVVTEEPITTTPTVTVTQSPVTVTNTQTTQITSMTTVTETKTQPAVTETQTITESGEAGNNDWVMYGLLVVAVIIAVVLIVNLIIRLRYWLR
jgi:hypothetical protein